MGFIANMMNLLFPPKCPFCKKLLKSGETMLCEACKKDLPYTGAHGITETGDFYKTCVSPLYYTDTVRESILRFKFKGASHYAKCYGAFVADCVQENLKGRYDLITWVPLSAKRKKTRGYDQAMLLAMATALALSEVAAETLIKLKDTPPQSGLEAAEARRANVVGAYAVQDTELIAGKRILLVDDVVTTGSTLSECARMLLMEGAAEVTCACLAQSAPAKTRSRARE